MFLVSLRSAHVIKEAAHTHTHVHKYTYPNVDGKAPQAWNGVEHPQQEPGPNQQHPDPKQHLGCERERVGRKGRRRRKRRRRKRKEKEEEAGVRQNRESRMYTKNVKIEGKSMME